MFRRNEEEGNLLGFGFLGTGLCRETNLPVLKYYDKDVSGGPEVLCLEGRDGGVCKISGKPCRRFWDVAERLEGKVKFPNRRAARNALPDVSGEFAHTNFVCRGVCAAVREECLTYLEYGDGLGMFTYCDNFVEDGDTGACTVCGMCVRRYPPDGPTSAAFHEN